jgi:hypothetical protein
MSLWHSIAGIITSADTVTLIIMAVVAIGAGFAMQGIGSIVTATFGALVLFALATFVRAALASKNAMSLAQSDWHSLLMMQVQVVLSYAIAFAVVIAIIHYIRSLLVR